MTLEGLKSEALDAFGLFDVSIGDGTMIDDSPSEERKCDLKSMFTLSLRISNQDAGQLPSFIRLESDAMVGKMLLEQDSPFFLLEETSQVIHSSRNRIIKNIFD